MKNSTTHKLTAEFLGTMFFVLIGCGVAITTTSLAGLGVCLAFGLAFAAAHYITSPSFASWLCKKMELKDFLFYVAAQLLGATAGIAVLYFVLMGKTDFNHMFFSNGFGISSPNGSGLMEAGVIEVILSSFFILTFCMVKEAKGSCACSSLMLGLTLSVAYFLATPFTNGSLNPARSFGPAIFEGGMALQQVWFFFVMPMVGAALAVVFHKLLGQK